MKKNYLTYLFLFLLFLISCDDIEDVAIVPVVLEEKSCVLNERNFKKDSTVQIWYVKDTTEGFASGIKIWKDWRAKVDALLFEDGINISFITYLYDKGDVSIAEVLNINGIPEKIGCYKLLLNTSPSPKLGSSYYISDDDTVLNRYTLDEKSDKNYLEITKIDTINNIIEGKLMATFLRDKSKPKFWQYQDTMRFANVFFWAKIQ